MFLVSQLSGTTLGIGSRLNPATSPMKERITNFMCINVIAFL